MCTCIRAHKSEQLKHVDVHQFAFTVGTPIKTLKDLIFESSYKQNVLVYGCLKSNHKILLAKFSELIMVKKFI